MISIRFASRLPNALSRGLALFALAGLCGCATLTFKSTRQSRFINMDGKIVHVDYGKEKRTETMPNGLVCTYDGKVRLQLPDGKRVVLYQALTASGVRYVSQDKHYVFIEKGPYCMIYRDNKPFFEGVFCRK